VAHSCETYDASNDVASVSKPLNSSATATTSPVPNSNTAASVTQFQYVPNGELTQITDPKGNTTTITYNSVGLISSITDAQNHTTSYQYDVRGNRTAVIDPINGVAHATSFTYDIMSRLTGITYPDGSTASFTYDSRGRRTSPPIRTASPRPIPTTTQIVAAR
jgi:YD repeat-containing protein